MKVLKKSNLAAYKKVVKLGPDKAIALVKERGLRGRGGANFLTGLKWELTRKASSDEKFVICNADEGEPGTFKDRLLLEKNPENVIEGILIACYCVGAEKAYIYLRGEYSYLIEELERVIENVLKNAKSKLDIEIVPGAGAYVCGDETAILNSISNKRGYPHFKPPYPPQEGLFGKPTVINNVETMANVPLAVIDNKFDDNLRLFSISGNVSKPGVYELKVGVTMKEIVELVKPRNKVNAFYFGAAGGCIHYDGKTKLDAKSVASKGAMLGSNTIIVVDEKQSIVDVALNVAKFFRHESCGKCTPCREGNLHVVDLLSKVQSGKASVDDLKLLKKLSVFIKDTSLCGLGQSCTNHVLTALEYFGGEFNVK